MRHCPTLHGDDRPLIAHSIETGVCMKRQGGFHHKCHRCVFRGKRADFSLPLVHRNGIQAPAVPMRIISAITNSRKGKESTSSSGARPAR